MDVLKRGLCSTGGFGSALCHGFAHGFLLPDGCRSSESSCFHAHTAILLVSASLLKLLVWKLASTYSKDC
jgi:hypothetical protein